MDTGESRYNPSLFFLISVALVCGWVVLCAYQDRLNRVAEAEVAPPAPPPPGEAPLSEDWVVTGESSGAALTGPAVLPSAPVEPPRDLVVYQPIYRDPLYRDPLPSSEAVRLPAPGGAGPESSAGESRVVATLPEPDLQEPSQLALTAPGELAEQGTFDLQPDDLPLEDERQEGEETLLVEGEPSPTESDPALDETPLRLAKPVTPIEEDESDLEVYDDEAAITAAETSPQDLLTYSPAAGEISQRVAGDVRAAFALGRHGALYAARKKFIEAMTSVAAAKDAQMSTDRHARALDEGFAALAEAQDFLPGGAVSKDLTVAEAAASHRTPMLRGKDRAAWTLPHEAAALYYRFAEQKLSEAVGGEQAGSMALYGLGKTHAQLYRVEGSALDRQRTLAMHRAALLAHRGNHLAANELGVGLAQGGHYQQAADALQQSIAHGGGSTVYRNLAHVHHKLGQNRLAQQVAERAERLAVQERAAGLFSRERGVQWVPPQRMASRTAVASRPAPLRTAPAPPRQTPVAFQHNPTASPIASRTSVR